MGNTPRYALPYAGLNDPPHGPNQEQALAVAVEAALGILDDDVHTRGRVASLASSPSDSMAFGTSESVGRTLSATLVSGGTYRAGMVGIANAVTVRANGFFKLRYIAGGTGSTSGTVVPGGQIAPNLSPGGTLDNGPFALFGEFVAPSSAQYSVAFTGKSSSSTVNVVADAANHAWLFTLDRVA